MDSTRDEIKKRTLCRWLGNFGSSCFAKEFQRLATTSSASTSSETRVASLADSLSQAMIVKIARDDAATRRDAGFVTVNTAVVAMGSDLEASTCRR